MTAGWHRKRITPAETARRAKYASTEHRAARRRLARDVAAGTASCWRCGHGIPSDTLWDVGHDDHDVNLIRGPEHRACNRRAAARKGNAMRRTAPATFNPSW